MLAPTISIVSDERDGLESIVQGLQSLGFAAYGYTSLKTAIQTALSAPPALMVIDLALGAGQFRKLLDFLRQNEKLRQLALILISDALWSDPALQSSAERLAILTKPLTLGSLSANIHRLLPDAAKTRTCSGDQAQQTLRYSFGAHTDNEGCYGEGWPHFANFKAPESETPQFPEQTRTDPHKGRSPAAELKKIESLKSAILPPEIHSVAVSWIHEEIEIIVNGCHFLSNQEAQEALNGAAGTCSQINLDGVAIPTIFYSSSQLKSRVASGPLAGRCQCTLKVCHPSPCTASTPELRIQLPPPPDGLPGNSDPQMPTPNVSELPRSTKDSSRINMQPHLVSVTPNEISSNCRDLQLIVEGHHICSATRAYLDGTEIPLQRLSSQLATIPLGACEDRQPGIHILTLKNSEGNQNESDALPITVVPTEPEIAYLLPGSCEVGEPGLQLEIHGLGFGPNEKVVFNGSARITEFVSSNCLATHLRKEDLSAAAKVTVSVSGSEPQFFLIFNRVPEVLLVSMQPNSRDANTLDIHIHGKNFNASSRVFEGERKLPCKLEGDGSLTAVVSRADLKGKPYLLVSVWNPPPGGGRTPVKATPFDGLRPASCISPLLAAGMREEDVDHVHCLPQVANSKQ
jgi:hypothetical protein